MYSEHATPIHGTAILSVRSLVCYAKTMHQSTNRTAFLATLHCLAGCSIGEVGGLLLGTGFGWTNSITIPVSIALAFAFGYSLSLLPVVRSGISFKVAIRLVLAADTLSVLTMEVVDNIVMLVW